ncbi:DUF748 domain-containing protein [Bdellovibrio bacteriovorus]|uniref:DUF748 domain-containing protein n=1 Tax=Bdellovibrio TaxID=958 RepID=UPI0035A919B7
MRKISLGVLAALLLYCILGFLLVPFIAKDQIRKTVEAKFGVQAEIQKVSFNPFTFEMTLEGFKLPAADGKTDSKNRLQFEKFSLNLEIFPLFKKEIRFSSVVLKAVQGQFIIFKDGATNWVMKEDKTQPESKEKSDWILTLEQIQIENSGFDILDNTHLRPLDLPLGPLNLKASNISTSLNSQTSLNSLLFSVGEKGHVKVSGTLSLEPVAADINLDVAALPLDFLTSYLSDKTYLSLQKGTIDLLGNLKYQKGVVLFDGASEIHELSLTQENVEEPVFSWEKMALKNIKFKTVPMSFHVDEVHLSQPRTAVILRKDGTLNFKTFLRTITNEKTTTPVSQTPTEEKTSSKDSFDYLVSNLIVANGAVAFADQQIKPNFSADIHGLDGTIGPISPKANQKINVALAGLVEAYGKFNAKGNVTPGEKRPSLDLDVDFHNIEMTTFTPYSGRFMGYEIKKGKLFLDLNYTLVNNRIRGKNQVLLDQFTLGDKVESEHSTNLPLKLALALMKDRKGQIKFKLPVEGDVNSPSFSFGNLIWTALKNMLINIVAAPFDFLASLIGGGPDLQMVFFEPGTSVLSPNQTEKMDQLVKALDERPNLALEIRGEYQDQDIEALQKKSLDIQLDPFLKKNKDRASAVRSFAKSNWKRSEFNDFVDSYESAHGKNEAGLVAELEKKLTSSILITEDELKALCLARGNIVMKAILDKKIPAERLYLLAGAKAGNEKPSHALLTIKDQ